MMESITTAKGREKAAKASKAMGKAAEHYGNNAIDNAIRSVFGKSKKSSSAPQAVAKPRSSELSENRAAYARDVMKTKSKLSVGAGIGATIGKYGKRPSSKPKAR